MKKEFIKSKLALLLEKNNIIYKISNVENERIVFEISSVNKKNTISLIIMDTDIMNEVNDFGINIERFKFSDEIYVLGYGAESFENKVYRLSNIIDDLKEIINNVFEICYITSNQRYMCYYRVHKEKLNLEMTKFEQQYNAKIISISNFEGEVIYQN